MRFGQVRSGQTRKPRVALGTRQEARPGVAGGLYEFAVLSASSRRIIKSRQGEARRGKTSVVQPTTPSLLLFPSCFLYYRGCVVVVVVAVKQKGPPVSRCARLRQMPPPSPCNFGRYSSEYVLCDPQFLIVCPTSYLQPPSILGPPEQTFQSHHRLFAATCYGHRRHSIGHWRRDILAPNQSHHGLAVSLPNPCTMHVAMRRLQGTPPARGQRGYSEGTMGRARRLPCVHWPAPVMR